jgi:hypothetical protein
MKITELVLESQQLDEGPIAQAIGRGAGKIAKGAANVGKDVKAGFQSGFSGEQPAAAPAAPKQGIMSKIKQAASDFKAGYQGAAQTAAPEKPAADAPAPAAPAATDTAQTVTPAPAAPEKPAADAPAPAAPAATEKPATDAAPTQGSEDVDKLKRQLASLTSDVQLMSRTMGSDRNGVLTDIANIKKQLASLTKPDQATVDADRERIMGKFTDSVERHKQRMVAEGLTNGTISIYKR